MDISKRYSARSTHQLSLVWRNLEYSLVIGKKELKPILCGLSGRVDPGQLLAILGPSGSGKSSLLNALAERLPITKGATYEGELLLNGRPAKDMAAISAYVEQDDTLFALSTVTETLEFMAALRLPVDSTEEDRKLRVEQVMAELGLLGVKDTVIGNTTLRGVSGGERRRVSIGTHLIDNPMMVFLDEPTSGLDSFQAQNVMETLRGMASSAGRTVVASIHQPRSSIYSMLDRILLLANGHTVYFGEAGAACSNYFREIGHPAPSEFNPADHFLDTISINYKSEEDVQITKSRVEALKQAWLSSQACADVAATTAGIGPADSIRSADASEHSLERMAGPGFWRPFCLLAQRGWREMTRNKQELCLKYCMNVAFSLLFGIIYFRMNHSQTSIQDRTGILFFQAMNQAFGSTIGCSTVIPVQLLVVNRERASKLYGILPFYVASFVINLPLEFLPQIVYAVTVYYMTNLRGGFIHFVWFLVVLSLENFAGIGLGMVISASISSVEMAPQLAPAFVIIFLMFSGYFLNENSIPVYVSWMKYISFIRYAFQAFIVNEFEDSEFDCGKDDEVCLDGNEYIERLNFQDVSIPMNCLYLVLTIVGFNVLAFAVLVYKRPKFLQIGVQKGQAAENHKQIEGKQGSAIEQHSKAAADTKI